MENKFVVIGEKCQDVFIYGHVLRLSPEAPIPIFTPINTVTSFGMAENVKRNLESISKNQGVNIHIDSFISNGCGIKTRYVDEKSNHYFLRVDTYDDCYEPFVLNDEHKNTYQNADMIIISDYNKGYLKPSDYTNIRKCATEAIIIADTKKILCEEIMDSVDFVKMNMTEFDRNYETLGYDFFNQYESKIIITNGGNGAEYMERVFPTENVNTIDVSGAGDTFLASFCYEYSQTYSVNMSIEFANKMSSQVVKKRGVSTI